MVNKRVVSGLFADGVLRSLHGKQTEILVVKYAGDGRSRNNYRERYRR
jgi:hypothetical protein